MNAQHDIVADLTTFQARVRQLRNTLAKSSSLDAPTNLPREIGAALDEVDHAVAGLDSALASLDTAIVRTGANQ